MFTQQMFDQVIRIGDLSCAQKRKQKLFFILMVNHPVRVEIVHDRLCSKLCLLIASMHAKMVYEFLQRGALIHNAFVAVMQHLQRRVESWGCCIGG